MSWRKFDNHAVFLAILLPAFRKPFCIPDRMILLCQQVKDLFPERPISIYNSGQTPDHDASELCVSISVLNHRTCMWFRQQNPDLLIVWLRPIIDLVFHHHKPNWSSMRETILVQSTQNHFVVTFDKAPCLGIAHRNVLRTPYSLDARLSSLIHLRLPAQVQN